MDLFLDIKYNDKNKVEKGEEAVELDEEEIPSVDFFSNEDKDQELLDDELHRNEFPDGIYDDARHSKNQRKLSVLKKSSCHL